MTKGRQADSARRRQRVIAALSNAAADGAEISVSGIARAAAVDRTFLYRHRDLLGKIHALEATPPAAGEGPGPAVTRASLQADLLAAHERAVRLNARVQQLRNACPRRSANRPGANPGSARPPTSTPSPRRSLSLEQQAIDLRLQARRTRPGPHRSPGCQPRAHGPAQRHCTPALTRRHRQLPGRARAHARCSTTPVALQRDTNQGLEQP